MTNDPSHDVSTLVATAELYRSLHDPAHPLALATVRDAGSAAVVDLVRRTVAVVDVPVTVDAAVVEEFAAMGVAREAAEELLGTGSVGCLEEGLEFGETNGSFTR